MPSSIGPLPADDELECARCGEYFYYGLTHCPNCGVNIYEPEDLNETEFSTEEALSTPGTGLISSLSDLLRKLVSDPESARAAEERNEEHELYQDLLLRVTGVHEIAERLIAYERRRSPDGHMTMWLKDAISRWQRDNS